MLQQNQWIKSSKSNGNGGNNCVETLLFVKAAKSNPSGNCVEVAFNKAAKSLPSGDNCVEVGFNKASKSGYPTGTACVEVGFNKAGQSQETSCVETAQIGTNDDALNCLCGCDQPLMNGQPIKGAKPGDVVVRDSKQNGTTDQPYLVFTPEEWSAYIRTLMMGYGAIHNGQGLFVIAKEGKTLVYTTDEWDAFMDGVRKQEFAYPEAVGV